MFNISPILKQNIRGTTCSGKKCNGTGSDFSAQSDSLGFQTILRYESWENCERNINCITASGNPRLSTVVGRLRLTIEKYNDSKDQLTLKTAVLVSEEPPHATLHNRSFMYYKGFLGVDIEDILLKLPQTNLGTKELLLNASGREKSELCLIYPSEDQTIPLIVFILTRILPVTRQTIFHTNNLLYLHSPKYV